MSKIYYWKELSAQFSFLYSCYISNPGNKNLLVSYLENHLHVLVKQEVS